MRTGVFNISIIPSLQFASCLPWSIKSRSNDAGFWFSEPNQIKAVQTWRRTCNLWSLVSNRQKVWARHHPTVRHHAAHHWSPCAPILCYFITFPSHQRPHAASRRGLSEILSSSIHSLMNYLQALSLDVAPPGRLNIARMVTCGAQSLRHVKCRSSHSGCC